VGGNRASHEPGALLQQGWQAGLGYGEAIGVYIDRHPDLFPHRSVNVAWQAYRWGIPARTTSRWAQTSSTQHPSVDFAAIGGQRCRFPQDVRVS
jgi:hypothetical protein